MEKYIPKVGDKVFGFDYKQTEYKSRYNSKMDGYIGKVGVVGIVHEETFLVKFDDNYWWYPVELAYLALMKEEDKHFKFSDRVKFTESSLESGMIDARKDDVFTVKSVHNEHWGNVIRLNEIDGVISESHLEHVKEETMTNTENEIYWQVGQEVYCILHGKGVVQDVLLPDYFSYPVKVDREGKIYSYTKDGKFHKEHKSRTLFFSEPEIVAEKYPPKKPFVPSFTKGETVVAKKKDGQSTVVFYVDKETEISVESASCGYLKAEYNFHKLGVEIKFS